MACGFEGRDYLPHTAEGLVSPNLSEKPLVDLVDSYKTNYFFNRDGPAWALAFSKAGFRYCFNCTQRAFPTACLSLY